MKIVKWRELYDSNWAIPIHLQGVFVFPGKFHGGGVWGGSARTSEAWPQKRTPSAQAIRPNFK